MQHKQGRRDQRKKGTGPYLLNQLRPVQGPGMHRNAKGRMGEEEATESRRGAEAGYSRPGTHGRVLLRVGEDNA